MTRSNIEEWDKENDQVNQVIAHIISELIEITLEELLTCQVRITTSSAEMNK